MIESFVFVLGCQDIDDALHARQLENGNIEAGVRKSLRPIPYFFLFTTLDFADVS